MNKTRRPACGSTGLATCSPGKTTKAARSPSRVAWAATTRLTSWRVRSGRTRRRSDDTTRPCALARENSLLYDLSRNASFSTCVGMRTSKIVFVSFSKNYYRLSKNYYGDNTKLNKIQSQPLKIQTMSRLIRRQSFSEPEPLVRFQRVDEIPTLD